MCMRRCHMLGHTELLIRLFGYLTPFVQGKGWGSGVRTFVSGPRHLHSGSESRASMCPTPH